MVRLDEGMAVLRVSCRARRFDRPASAAQGRKVDSACGEFDAVRRHTNDDHRLVVAPASVDGRCGRVILCRLPCLDRIGWIDKD